MMIHVGSTICIDVNYDHFCISMPFLNGEESSLQIITKQRNEMDIEGHVFRVDRVQCWRKRNTLLVEIRNFLIMKKLESLKSMMRNMHF